MYRFLFTQIILLSFFINSSAQNFTGSSDIPQKYPELSAQFTQSNIFRIDSDKLNEFVKNKNSSMDVHFILGKKYNWHLQMEAHDIRSAHYKVKVFTENGIIIQPHRQTFTFRGNNLSDEGGIISLTIDKGFIYGYVEEGNKTYFIEPLYKFVSNAHKDDFVIYETIHVIPREGTQCGYTEMNQEKQKQKKHKEDHLDEMEKMLDECWTLEYAVAHDFQMVQDEGSVTAAENHAIGVMNNVQNDFDTDFIDEVNFEIVTQFVSDCSTCDPWSSTTNAETLLTSFRNWANGGGFGVTHDLGGLWTGRNIQVPGVGSGVIGIASINAVCTNFRYHVLENFTNNANNLRVLTSHEIGHNFGAFHDDSGTPFIMAPSVNGSSTWSSSSMNSINSTINNLGGGCLAACSSPLPPVTDFLSVETNICPMTSVQFIDLSINNPTSWNWNFSGGSPSSSSQQNPEITFNTAGTYTVTLTASNNSGSDVETKSAYIIVGQNGSEVLFYDDFEHGLNDWTIYNPDNQTTWQTTNVGGSTYGSSAAFIDNYDYNASGQHDGLETPVLDFTDRNNIALSFHHAYARYNANNNETFEVLVSTNGGVSFPNVVFSIQENGSGNFATISAQTSQFTPSTSSDWCTGTTFGPSCFSIDLSAFAGEPNVKIRIENINDFGNNLYIDNVKITSDCLAPPAPPVAAFTSNIQSGCLPLNIQFTDLTSNNPSSWQWSFPGASPSSSSQQNPSVSYNTPGIYDVTLVASNGAGTNTVVESSYIVVEDTPVASFTSNIFMTGVNFINTSQGGSTYFWDFGDNTTSTNTNPSHFYTEDGTYTVILTVQGICGLNTFSDQIVITSPPTANFTSDITSGCTPLQVQFTNLSSSNVATLSWSFPGGSPNSSSDENPLITYNQEGSYDVILAVSNASGSDVATLTNYINVQAPPIASFTCNQNEGNIDFINLSTNATDFLWDFGDGMTSTDINPNHTFNGPGPYTIVLTTSNSCSSSTSTEILQTYYADGDNDNYGDINNSVFSCEQPLGFVLNNTDCDDSSSAINPGASEICNDVDDNCNMSIDEGVGTIYYLDNDDDGFGDPNTEMLFCNQPVGYVLDNTDCDDNNENIHPNATEICNGVDDNCDGHIDEICPGSAICNDNVIFINPIMQPIYFAYFTIFSDALITENENITFHAGDSIVLNSGFEVELGGEFYASIEECTVDGEGGVVPFINTSDDIMLSFSIGEKSNTYEAKFIKGILELSFLTEDIKTIKLQITNSNGLFYFNSKSEKVNQKKIFINTNTWEKDTYLFHIQIDGTNDIQKFKLKK